MSVEAPKQIFLPTAREVLGYLQTKFGFGLWMVTRTSCDDWVVLAAEDKCYSVKEGDVFKWTDSFCSRMVQGKGPRIAPRSDDVPAYLEAPIGRQVPIGAYVGVPLHRKDGALFGTLCAIDPEPQPDELTAELPQIELLARLLQTILETELQAQEEHRRAERAEALAMTDSLTGLFNRRGWDKLMAAEEMRCKRYLNPAAVISIDLDDLKRTNDVEGHSSGDRLLIHTAQAIKESIRKTDVAARIGGDEFLILAVECSEHGIKELSDRLNNAFVACGVSASFGYGFRSPHSNLTVASEVADKAMYEMKRQRKHEAI